LRQTLVAKKGFERLSLMHVTLHDLQSIAQPANQEG
jgi:hypothetical protein